MRMELNYYFAFRELTVLPIPFEINSVLDNIFFTHKGFDFFDLLATQGFNC